MRKIIQVPIGEEISGWMAKSMKEMKIKKQAEFVRTLLSYLMNSDISDLKTKMEKTRITTMLQEAEEKASYALKIKTELEKQLEKLNA